MKLKTYFPIIFLLLALSSSAQFKVMDISEVPRMQNLQVMADVKGKVLVSSDYPEYVWYSDVKDSVTPFPLWPVPKVGQNERGCILQPGCRPEI